MNLLEVRDLTVSSPAGPLVKGLGFDLGQAGALGIVGQSGAGKSLSAMALCGLLPHPLSVSRGIIRLHGDLIPPNDPKAWRRVRGKEIFLIFQSPASALNPTAKVGSQIAEALVETCGWNHERAMKRTRQLLDAVELPTATTARYAFELSGGMRQRVLIAIALAMRPRVLIADEPTTGLDSLNRMAVLRLLKRLREEHHTALLIISHDLGVISLMADDLLIMENGAVVERGPASHILRHPNHSHTVELVEAMHRMEPNHA